MDIDLRGRTAFITGGSGAIGSAMCRRFAECGASVVIADLHEDRGRALEAELGRSALFAYADVTDVGSVREAVKKALNKFGGIDILINNAGYNTPPDRRATIEGMPESEWLNAVDICLSGAYRCAKAVVPDMIARRSGRIVNIASIVGQVPLRNQCAYAAAKAGLIGFTKALAMELAEYGILVNAISPGSVINEGLRVHFYADREKSAKILSHIPLGRPGEPEEIANIAAFAASDKISYMTGSVMTVDGGWIAGDCVAGY
jgi:NAD(P)-dependent dehydrogenase (short-subunit alcohol dehydrogenase family)